MYSWQKCVSRRHSSCLSCVLLMRLNLFDLRLVKQSSVTIIFFFLIWWLVDLSVLVTYKRTSSHHHKVMIIRIILVSCRKYSLIEGIEADSSSVKWNFQMGQQLNRGFHVSSLDTVLVLIEGLILSCLEWLSQHLLFMSFFFFFLLNFTDTPLECALKVYATFHVEKSHAHS